MTHRASYVTINDSPDESKCATIVKQTWKRISCDIQQYCSNQNTPVQMYQSLVKRYGEPSVCIPSIPDKNVVGFAQWNFESIKTDDDVDAKFVNQITVRDEFVYNDAPDKHVDLVTSRIKMDVYDNAAKTVLNTMNDSVHVDALQQQLYVRSDELDRSNDMIAAAILVNTKHREFVDKPADLFDYFIKSKTSVCYFPDDVEKQRVCSNKPVVTTRTAYDEQKQRRDMQRKERQNEKDLNNDRFKVVVPPGKKGANNDNKTGEVDKNRPNASEVDTKRPNPSEVDTKRPNASEVDTKRPNAT